MIDSYVSYIIINTMVHDWFVLLVAAASLGFMHTLFGPDHYIPFIAMSKSGNWSLRKTLGITVVCGIGHVLSSFVIGIIGIACGIAVTTLAVLESFRETIAVWALLAFGLVYFVYGIKQALRNKPHHHFHSHENQIIHEHMHTHNNVHAHAHIENKNLTPWILFAIFIFGPCEPLIPLLMYPAAKGSFGNLILVTAMFSLTTIMTMMGAVLISTWGISFIPISRLERFTHAVAGATIFLCGLSIRFMGV